MKTCQKWKPNQDNNIFHPNLLHIISGHFVQKIWVKNVVILGWFQFLAVFRV